MSTKDTMTACEREHHKGELRRVEHLVAELKGARDKRSEINLNIRQLERHLESLGYDCDGVPFVKNTDHAWVSHGGALCKCTQCGKVDYALTAPKDGCKHPGD